MNILGLLGGGGNNIMLQAFGAMMQGQKPEQFLQNLAKSSPQLQGIDFTNLQKSAENLYKSKGVDIEQAKRDATNQFNHYAQNDK
jgi:hypothetical protein